MSLTAGSRARLRSLEALRGGGGWGGGGGYALSCSPSHMFKHSHTKWDFKRTVDPNLGGLAPAAPPSGSDTALLDPN